MSRNIIIFLFLISGILGGFNSRSQAAAGESCTVARVISEGPVSVTETLVGGSKRQVQKKIVRYGNGFALRARVLAIVDHNIVGESESVQIILPTYINGVESHEPITGKIVARDFHTDLAFVEIPESHDPLKVCTLSAERNSALGRTTIHGFREDNQNASDMTASIVENKSKNLLVPAYQEAMALEFSSRAPTLSGSPIMESGLVIGIINTQYKTQYNDMVLAAHATDVRAAAKALFDRYLAFKNTKRQPGQYAHLDRNYDFNYKNETFEFSGLLVDGALQQAPVSPEILGTKVGAKKLYDGPVIAEGNPHIIDQSRFKIYGNMGSDNFPVAGEKSDLGYVIARLDREKTEALRERNPELAKRLETSVDNMVLIYRIDKLPTRNIMELIRALESSPQDYQITEALTRYSTFSNTGSPYELSIYEATTLLQLIRDDAGISFGVKENFEKKMMAFIGVLSELEATAQKTGGRSLELESKAAAIWKSLDSGETGGELYLLRTYLSRTERALRDGIRSRAPVNN